MTTHAPQHRHLPRFPAPVDRARRVVVGVDADGPTGLAHARAALALAATEAAWRGGDVLAVHGWSYPTAWGFPAGGWGLPAAWPAHADPSQRILDELQPLVDALARDRAAAGAPAVVVTTEVVQGTSADVLLSAATGTALLVIGSPHHGWLLGSVSDGVLHHRRSLPCPVLVVPAP